ncbi:hypothetical protein [Granulibacter bethesdensis]|uniref:hypothetical protein n=1 Tax=Granulibacter bethesdensis TaxID=364410 RepID=UPI0003F1FAAB|nr:hypothetical protein [Granulibacter bethesdensis]AHJ64712.1 Hypothetical protein GbCGDNIH4_0323 [Granulibacter bethesdensis CGDNIH4]
MPRISAFNNPSLLSPRFRFNTGSVENGRAEYYARPPELPYTVNSQWDIIQWHSESFLNPSIYTTENPLYADNVLGTADYTWTNEASTMALSVYGSPGQWTYRITTIDGQDGSSANMGDTSPGGRNLFLSTSLNAASNYTFDKQITFSSQQRLSEIFQTGHGQGATFGLNSFTIAFNSQSNPHYNAALPTLNGFLQFPLADSRGAPPSWGRLYFSGTNFAWNALSSDAGGDYLKWGEDQGALHNITIDLNSAVVDLARNLALEHSSYSSSLMNMSLWSLGSYFYGGESLDGTGATFDIADPVISRDTDQNFDASMANSKFVTISNNYQTVYDTGLASTAKTQWWFASPSGNASIDMDGQTLHTNVVISNNDTVYAGSADGFIFANGPGMKLVGGSGYSVPVLSKGNDTVTGGTGQQLVFLGSAGTLSYHTQASTLQPAGDSTYRHWVIGDGINQDQTLNFVGGGVKSAIFLGHEDASLQLGNAGDFVSIGFGATRPALGGGTVSIVMGAGDDTVWVNSLASGPLTISNFDPNHDRIALIGQQEGITRTYPTSDTATRYLLNSGKYLDIYTSDGTRLASGDNLIHAVLMQ